jgi:hypothetical protein
MAAAEIAIDMRGLPEVEQLVSDMTAEILRLRALVDAVVEAYDPVCPCDHYPRNDCPCARVRKLLDGASFRGDGA